MLKRFAVYFNKNQFIREVFIYGIGNLTLAAVPLVMTPLLTRSFSMHQYGVIDLIYTTILILSMCAGLNLDAALLRFYYDSEYNKRAVISSVFILSIVSSIFFCLGSFLLFGFLKGHIFKTSEEINCLFIALLSMPFIVCLTNELMLIRVQRKPSLFVLMSSAIVLLTLILTIVLIKYTIWIIPFPKIKSRIAR